MANEDRKYNEVSRGTNYNRASLKKEKNSSKLERNTFYDPSFNSTI